MCVYMCVCGCVCSARRDVKTEGLAKKARIAQQQHDAPILLQCLCLCLCPDGNPATAAQVLAELQTLPIADDWATRGCHIPADCSHCSRRLVYHGFGRLPPPWLSANTPCAASMAGSGAAPRKRQRAEAGAAVAAAAGAAAAAAAAGSVDGPAGKQQGRGKAAAAAAGSSKQAASPARKRRGAQAAAATAPAAGGSSADAAAADDDDDCEVAELYCMICAKDQPDTTNVSLLSQLQLRDLSEFFYAHTQVFPATPQPYTQVFHAAHTQSPSAAPQPYTLVPTTAPTDSPHAAFTATPTPAPIQIPTIPHPHTQVRTKASTQIPTAAHTQPPTRLPTPAPTQAPATTPQALTAGPAETPTALPHPHTQGPTAILPDYHLLAQLEATEPTCGPVPGKQVTHLTLADVKAIAAALGHCLTAVDGALSGDATQYKSTNIRTADLPGSCPVKGLLDQVQAGLEKLYVGESTLTSRRSLTVGSKGTGTGVHFDLADACNHAYGVIMRGTRGPVGALAIWVFVRPRALFMFHTGLLTLYPDIVGPKGLATDSPINLTLQQISDLNKWLSREDVLGPCVTLAGEKSDWLLVLRQEAGHRVTVPVGWAHMVINQQPCLKVAWDDYRFVRSPLYLAVANRVLPMRGYAKGKDNDYIRAELETWERIKGLGVQPVPRVMVAGGYRRRKKHKVSVHHWVACTIGWPALSLRMEGLHRTNTTQSERSERSELMYIRACVCACVCVCVCVCMCVCVSTGSASSPC